MTGKPVDAARLRGHRSFVGGAPLWLMALGLVAGMTVPGQAIAQSKAKAKPVAVAPLETEELTVVELKDQMQPHWLIVNDVAFTHIVDGRAYLLDADSGQFLAMIPGGQSHNAVQVTPDGATLLVPATFMARGSRGARTDVVTWFSLRDLQPATEVEIPAKRIQALPLLSAMPLSDDGRFLLIYNFTPEQTMSVVDVVNKRFVGEYETPGCALAHMTGPRSFLMQCADGSLQGATLDESGAITPGATTEPLFERDDPATDKPIRMTGADWLFITFSGAVALVSGEGQPSVKARWKLTGEGEQGWRPGGLQPYAYHAATGRLFVLMHEGGPGTHKHPGTEIWVFDAATQTRTARIPIETPSTSIAISQDAAPLLYTALFGSGTLVVRKPEDASVIRKIEGLGPDLTLIQPAPIPAAAADTAP